MDVKGKNVFTTGSTRGIGKAMALVFAKAGAGTILNGCEGISREKIEEIEAFGVKCVGISGGISDYEKAGQMIEEAEEKLGSIHVLINNAGVANDKLVMRMDTEDLKKCLDINLTGTFNMMRRVLKEMMKQRERAIINLSSVSGLIGDIGQTNYAVSKADVAGLTKSMAQETAIRGITCNAITPRFITIDMMEALVSRVKEQAER